MRKLTAFIIGASIYLMCVSSYYIGKIQATKHIIGNFAGLADSSLVKLDRENWIIQKRILTKEDKRNGYTLEYFRIDGENRKNFTNLYKTGRRKK